MRIFCQTEQYNIFPQTNRVFIKEHDTGSVMTEMKKRGIPHALKVFLFPEKFLVEKDRSI